MSHISITHVTHTNESCHTYPRIMSRMSYVTRMTPACHTSVRAKSCPFKTHGAHMNMSRTHKRVISHSVLIQRRYTPLAHSESLVHAWISHVCHKWTSHHIHIHTYMYTYINLTLSPHPTTLRPSRTFRSVGAHMDKSCHK